MENKNEEVPILSLLQDIQTGRCNPRTISKEIRLQCVEFLLGQGYSDSDVAQILQVSEKTIYRDLQKIRKRNAVSPDPQLAKEIVGEFIRKANMHHARLMKIASNKDISPGERKQAEFMAWRVEIEKMETLQTLGYLPLKPKEIVLSHENAEMTFSEIEQTIHEIKTISQEDGTVTPQLEEQLKVFQARLEKARISHEVAGLLENQKKNVEEEEKDHG